MKKILVLFPNDWDKVEFSKEKYQNEYSFIYDGPDLFKFPQSLQLPFFSVQKYINRIIKKAQTKQIDAVLSSDEYLGAIIAAEVAQQLGLPGSDPSKIILAQHKYYSRLAQMEHCPEAAVNCELISQIIPKDFKPQLPFPFFVKPVKGTFSLFAKKVDNLKDLRKHLSFNFYERIILKSITRPFNQLLHRLTRLKQNANFFIGVELIEGLQVTVDGWKGCLGRLHEYLKTLLFL